MRAPVVHAAAVAGLAMLLTNLCLAAIGFVTQATAQPESGGARGSPGVHDGRAVGAAGRRYRGRLLLQGQQRNYDILMAEIHVSGRVAQGRRSARSARKPVNCSRGSAI